MHISTRYFLNRFHFLIALREKPLAIVSVRREDNITLESNDVAETSRIILSLLTNIRCLLQKLREPSLSLSLSPII